MPRWLRWAAMVLGGLLALVGLALILVLGPDSRFTTGPHAIDTDGIAVVTAPGSITWTGLQVDVLAEVPVNKPVFVGLANNVDLDNYLEGVERLEASSLLTPNTFLPFGTPHLPELTPIEGEPQLPGAPTALDWWLAKGAGLGGTEISATLPNESVSAVVLAVGSSNLNGLQVSFAYGIKGGFWKGLGLLALGGGGLWLVRQLSRDQADDADEFGDADEVLYVYVDEDGVEHELTAEEAADYEIVDEYVAEVDDYESGDVVYIYVDDDGVEHELTAEEAADYDVVDDDEPIDVPEPPTLLGSNGADGADSADGADGADGADAAGTADGADEADGADTTDEADAADGADAAGTADGADESDEADAGVEPEENDESRPTEPEASAVEPEPNVIYVVVDEHGVEHEVDEDELDDYEFVDDEDES